jgi:hypothetical protein
MVAKSAMETWQVRLVRLVRVFFSHLISPHSLTSSYLHVDATCVCTSSTSNGCTKLAQNLVTLTPTLNTLFSTNISTDDVATALWLAQGSPTGKNCASQAVLVDVASGLDANAAPNRTAWAQSALLWSTVRSQNLAAVETMRKFVVDAKWSSVSQDGPVQGSKDFQITTLGYTFDFAAQTVIAPQAKFEDVSQASKDQLSRVNNVAQSALDQLYTQSIGEERCFFLRLYL